MPSFSPELAEDADRLQRRWGVPIALEMLHERLITTMNFFDLCQEAASATVGAGDRRSSSGPPSSQAA